MRSILKSISLKGQTLAGARGVVHRHVSAVACLFNRNSIKLIANTDMIDLTSGCFLRTAYCSLSSLIEL